MDEGVTDDEGHFELQGKETEITNIDPKLNVYHVRRGELMNESSKIKSFFS
jgi:hypothetical protein